jgi:AraC family transcriptional regulator
LLPRSIESLKVKFSQILRDVISNSCALLILYLNNKQEEVMQVSKPSIKNLDPKLVAAVNYRGNYIGNTDVFTNLFGKLGGWAGPKGLLTPNSTYISSYNNDPNVTPADELELSACMTVPKGTKIDGDIEKKTLPGGKYLVMHAELVGPSEYEEAWKSLVDWAEINKYAVDSSRPSYEYYLNNPEEHPKKHHIVDICLGVKEK